MAKIENSYEVQYSTPNTYPPYRILFFFILDKNPAPKKELLIWQNRSQTGCATMSTTEYNYVLWTLEVYSGWLEVQAETWLDIKFITRQDTNIKVIIENEISS
jgi:hypothetical protein